jgi:hypothetical protein
MGIFFLGFSFWDFVFRILFWGFLFNSPHRSYFFEVLALAA